MRKLYKTVEMEKVLNSMPGANQGVKAQLVLEINAAHPIAEKLKKLFESDKDTLSKYSKLLYGEACLIGGKTVPDPAEHSALVCELMTRNYGSFKVQKSVSCLNGKKRFLIKY